MHSSVAGVNAHTKHAGIIDSTAVTARVILPAERAAALPLSRPDVIYISSNRTYDNVNFVARNELIVINSSLSAPVSLSFINSTAEFSNTAVYVNQKIADYGSFIIRVFDSTLKLNSSIINGNSTSAFSPALIELNGSTALVRNSTLSASGTIISAMNSGDIYLRGSEFSGMTGMIYVANSGNVLISSDSFVSIQPPVAHATYPARYTAIDISGSESLFFTSSHMNNTEGLQYTGLSARDVLHTYVNYSTFTFHPNATTRFANSSTAIMIAEGNSAEMNYLTISGGRTCVFVSSVRHVEIGQLAVSSNYSGITVNSISHGTISNVRSDGGTYAIVLQNSSNVSLTGDSAYGSLFGIRILSSSHILLSDIYEQYIISAVQLVKSTESELTGVFAELVPYFFNFAEFYGISVTGSSNITAENISLLSAPGGTGGFLDGFSVVLTNSSTFRDINMFFSGNFVSTAMIVYSSFRNSFDLVSVQSQGTGGDTGMLIIGSEGNSISNASVDIIGTQALLLQYSNWNTFSGTSFAVYGTSPHGVYLYKSNANRFLRTSIISGGYDSETGIVFNGAHNNTFLETRVQLTGSFHSAFLVQSIQSGGNLFRGFSYYSAAENLYWIMSSFLIAFTSAAGALAAAYPRKKRPYSKDEERRLRRIRL